MTRETLGARIFKHGICAATAAILLAIAVSMAGQMLQRSVATFAVHEQNVASITFR